MDVVYVLRTGDGNEELRHSLRSLANLTRRGRVWAAGYRPRWATMDEIPVQQHRTTFENSTANLAAACASPDVSDRFVYMNDDIFVLHRLQKIPPLHRGTVRQFVAECRRIYGRPGRYIMGLEATAELLRRRGVRDPICYEGHVPLVVDKRLMAEALRVGRDLRVLHYRTLYGNMARLGGEEIGDWKIRDTHSVPDPSWLFTSTVDSVFARGAVGQWLRERFPNPGAYEH